MKRLPKRSANGRFVADTAAPNPAVGRKAAAKTKRKPAKADKLAQQHAAAAVAALVAVMQDESASPAARISAAATLLQWGFGKAALGMKAKLPEDRQGRKSDYVIRLSWGLPASADENAGAD